MKRIFLNLTIIVALILLPVLPSCTDEFLDLKPYDALTSDQLMQDDEGMKGISNGSLRMMKDLLSASANNVYVRVLFQASEFPSDNVVIKSSTTDPLWLSFNRAHIPSQENLSYLWETGYKIIFNSNTLINTAANTEDLSDDAKQYLGECYFYRGMVFFDLARMFSFPPSHGADNKGIILRTELGEEDGKARASVGDTYAQIISDFKTAAELMTERETEGIKYGNKYAAYGYLSRAYLFNEQYDSVVHYANMLLDGNSPFELDSRENYINGLQNSFDSNENLFILYHDDTENRGSGAIGSMYNGDGGWGEIYPSKPFRDLIAKYPHDIRNALIDTVDTDNNGIPDKFPGTNIDMFYIYKFSYQNGVSTTHSPIFIRLSEVLLNRAEAYAHLGEDQPALDDVNSIRERAGLSGEELYTLANLASHGYSSVLDAVLDERRLELAFEGHRRDDLMRNKIDLDRSYVSAQNVNGETDIYPYNGDRQIYYIPASSEIAYNPLCEQND